METSILLNKLNDCEKIADLITQLESCENKQQQCTKNKQTKSLRTNIQKRLVAHGKRVLENKKKVKVQLKINLR